MANFYWYGGTGNWSDYTNHWSGNSGNSTASPKANAPTSSDNVFIDSNSGLSGGTIHIDATCECLGFTSNSGLNYTIDSTGGSFIRINSSLSLENSLTITDIGFLFASTTTGKTITTNGCIIGQNGVYINGVGGGWTLQDNLTCTGQFYQENGTFDANDHNVTANDFYFFADTGYTPTVVMGSGTWEARNGNGEGVSWYISENNGEVVTIVPETSTIKLNALTYDFLGSFYGGNKTYNNLWLYSTTGHYIGGSNTFNDLKTEAGTPVRFSPYSTQIISSLTAIGTIGNLINFLSTTVGGIATGHLTAGGTGYQVGDHITLDGGNSDAILNVDSVSSGEITGVSIVSVGTGYVEGGYSLTGGSGSNAYYVIDSLSNLAQFTLSKSSGTVSCDYLDLSNSNALGGATWYAGSHSADTTNNDGWIFTDPPATNQGNMFTVF
jgi:hypothetical protein